MMMQRLQTSPEQAQPPRAQGPGKRPGWLLLLLMMMGLAAPRAFAQLEPASVANVKNGLRYAYYETGVIEQLPDFSTMTPKATGEVRNFDLSIRQRNSRFGIVYEGYIRIDREGSYRFFTRHYEASKLYLNGQLVVNNDFFKPSQTERSGDVTLRPGYYALRLDYLDGCCTPGPLEVSYRLNNSTELPKQYIPDQVLHIPRLTEPVAEPEGLTAGVSYLYYEGQWASLPDFASLLPKKRGELPEVSLSPKDANTNFAFQYQGYVRVEADGLYTFFTNSKDGSKLYVGGHQVVDNDGLHSVRERSGVISLKKGLHPLRLTFFQQTGTPYLEVGYAGPGLSRQLLPASALARVPFAPVAPAAPQNLQATATAGAVTLSWEPVSGEGIRYGVFSQAGALLAVVANPAHTVSGLAPGTAYTYGVSAVDADGNQSAQSPVSATTAADTEAPSVPQGLTATGLSTQVTLRWRASSDNGTLAGYRVYDADNVLLQTVTDTVATISDLRTFTAYTFRVSAVDAAGNESGKASATHSTAFATGPQGGLEGWTETFADDFNGTSLDRSKWVTSFPWVASDGGSTNGGTAEIGWCLPRNVIVKDGKLRLRTVREKYTAPDGKTYDWTSAIVTTGRANFDLNEAVKYSYKYGYVEIRARMAKGRGAYSAFFMTPDDLSWPPELDIFEMDGSYPKTLHQTVHYLKPGGRDYSSKAYQAPEPLHDDFHTYGMLWLPGEVVWYVDGAETRREASPEIVPTTKRMVVELQSSVWRANGWGLGPDASTPDTLFLDVDHVRVWQKNDDILPANLREPAKVANLTSGLNYSYYEGNWTLLPTFSALTPVKTGVTPTLSLAEKNREDHFAFKYEGYVRVDQDGVYRFFLNSDDGSQLYVGSQLVVNNDGPQDSPFESAGAIGLRKGLHPVTITYFQRTGGQALTLSYEMLGSDGFAKRQVPDNRLLRLSPRPPDTPQDILPGVAYRYYEGYFETVPNFKTLTPLKVGHLTNFSLSPKGREDFFALKYDGFVQIEEAGVYTFFLNSDDGSKLWIGNELVVDHDGRHGAGPQMAGQIALEKGLHAITVGFFEFNFGETLEVRYEGPGVTKKLIPSGVLFREPFETEPPTAPGNLQASEVGATKLRLSWQPSTDNVGVAGYRVFRGTTLVATTTATTVAVGGLQPVTAYTFRVVAFDEVNNESAPASLSLTTTPYPESNYVALTSAPAIDGKPDQVWLNQPVRALPNTAVGTPKPAQNISAQFRTLWDSKNLYVLVEVTDDVLKDQLSPRNEFWKDDGVEVFLDVNNDKPTAYGANDYHYVFRWNDTEAIEVRKSNTAGVHFAHARTATGYTMEISLPWATLGAFVGNGALLGLDVHVADADEGIRHTKIAWSATADNAHTNPSVFGTVQLKKSTAVPPAPANLTATPAATSVALAWEQPEGTPAAHYTVYQGSRFVAAVTRTAHTVTGLDPLTAYTFRVVAVSEADVESPASSVTATTLDGQAPTVPANLTASATENSVTLTWEPSVDDVGVAGYRVFQGASLLTTVTETTHTVTGLAPLTAYDFKVSAVDAAGNASAFAAVSVTTPFPLRPADNPTGTGAGLAFTGYKGKWTSLPDFSALNRVDKTGTVSTFTIPSVYVKRDEFGLVLEGFVKVPADGIYTFYTNSDEGSKLYIGDTEVVDNDGLHSLRERAGTIGLKAGRHAIRVTYFEAKGSEVLQVGYAGPGLSRQEIPASALSQGGTVSGGAAALALDAETEDQVTVYPNPAADAFVIGYRSPQEQRVRITVTDALGRLALTKELTATAGENTIRMEATGLQRGMYLVVVSAGEERTVRKLLIAR